MKRKNKKPVITAAVLLYLIVTAGVICSIHPIVHALGKNTVTIDIGDGGDSVKAVLSEKGVLTISGKGRTRSYTEDTAPFEEYADQITSVKIEDGILSLGDYLFYNCKNIRGTLTLPESVIWIGDGAFAGSDQEHAPRFTEVISEFVSADIGRPIPGAVIPETETAAQSTENLATPWEAESTGAVSGEETESTPGENEGDFTESGETAPSMEETGAGDEETSADSKENGAGKEETSTDSKEAGEGSEDKAAAVYQTFSSQAGFNGRILKTVPTDAKTDEDSADVSPGLAVQDPEEDIKDGNDLTHESEKKPAHMDSMISTPSSAGEEDDGLESDDEEDPTEAYSEDGDLENDLYEDVIAWSEVGDTVQDLYQMETVTSQIIGTGIFFSGQTGAYQCSEENVTFIEAAQMAGYRKADRYIEVHMEGVTKSLPIIDGMLLAPELPEEISPPETNDPMFAEEFNGWIMEGDEGFPYDAVQYTAGTPIPVAEDTESLTLYANWEKTCTITPLVQVKAEENITTYTVVDENTGQPIPESDGYRIHYQWQICEPRIAGVAESADGEELLSWSDTGDSVTLTDSDERQGGPGVVETVAETEKTEIGPGVTGTTGTVAKTEKIEIGPGVTEGTAEADSPESGADAGVTEITPDETGITAESDQLETSPEQAENAAGADDQEPIEEQDQPGQLPENEVIPANPEDEDSWEDISGITGAVYTREAQRADSQSYFRVKISVEKVTFLRSASNAGEISVYSAPVMGKSIAQKIAVTYEPGEGGEGVPQAADPVEDGRNLAPRQNPFTRSDGQVFTGWLVTLHGVVATDQDRVTVNSGSAILQTEVLTLSAVSNDNPSVTLTAQWAAVTPVYLNGSSGNDEYSGDSEATAVRTLAKAYEKLTSDTMATNRIILCGNYTISSTTTLGAKPATITAAGGSGVLALNSVIICSADTTFENLSISGSSKIFGYGHKLVMGYGLTMSGTPNLYGGAYNANLTANTDLTVCSGTYQFVTGAGDTKLLTGNVRLTFYGGTVMDSIYGGGSEGSGVATDRVSGSVTIQFYGGTVKNVLYGVCRWGYIKGGSNTDIYGGTIGTVSGPHSGMQGGIEGRRILNIHGGTMRDVYGGGADSNTSNASRIPCAGGVTINMDGGTITGTVFCGSYGYWGSPNYDSIRNGIVANFSGGSIGGNLYGGSALDRITGDVTINLSDIAIGGNIFGGGEGGNNYNNKRYYARTDGTVTINIGNGVTVGGNIYGGANSYGTITKNVVISCSGTVGTAGAVRSIYGGGKGSGTTVDGNSQVTIDSGANITGNVFGGGDSGVVTKGTTVHVRGGNIGGSIFGAGNNVGTSAATVNLTGSPTIGAGIYGGSNNNGSVTNSVVNASGSFDQEIYGGGYGPGTTVVTSKVSVTDGAEITGDIYGGGKSGKVQNAVIELNGGKAARVFGGGYQEGISVTTRIISGSGSTAGTIYGGSNDQGSSVSPSITIAGTVTDVYGGGLGGGTTTTSPSVEVTTGHVSGNLFGGGNAGLVTGGTTVTLSGGNVASAFGGGNSAGITGTVTLQVKNGATATNIYGGSNSLGEVTSPQITVQGKVENVYGSGYGSPTITNSPTVTAEQGAVITNLHGGGKEGKTKAGTTVTLKSGSTVTNVFGGGSTADVEGTAAVSTENTAKADHIYGGSNNSGTVAATNLIVNGVTGTSEVPGTVYGGGLGSGTTTVTTAVTIGPTGTVTGEVFGGGAEGLVTGDASVALSTGSRIVGNIYAGGDAAVVKGSTHAQAESGATITGSVFGGGKGSTAMIEKNTRVIIFADVTGNVFGGGAEGEIGGDTHVDIAKGLIDGDGSKTGNVFGGSDKAIVHGNTLVHIGAEAAVGTGTPVTGVSLIIKGTVFGGGNTTDSGNTFDASNPFVLQNSEVSVDGTDYADGSFNIMSSIFGDGNMCTVKGTRTVRIKNYTALDSFANTSIQRADRLTIEGSQVELLGATDSANLVQTVAYSLNRIDELILKGGSTLKIQNSVNLVKGLKSLDASGTPVASTSTDKIGVKPDTVNRIDIQQGNQMELRTNEDVTVPGYGPVEGYMLLNSYDKDGKKIENGVYVLGNYEANESLGGFLYAEGDEENPQFSRITPTTDDSTWRNWALGTNMTRPGLMVMSNKPAGEKILQLESPWPADGSIYRLLEGTVEITTPDGYGGNAFTLKNPEELNASDPADTTLGISIRTGSLGWVSQVDAAYLEGSSGGGTNRFVKLSGETMQTINNRSMKPTLQIELTNLPDITVTDSDYTLQVQFQMSNVKEKADGTFAQQGILTVVLQIQRDSMQNYSDILLSTGKEYVRAVQPYAFDTLGGNAGATITSSSAVTLQYAKKSDSAETGERQLAFTANETPAEAGTPVTIPKGVTILAIDRSGTYPQYSHYTVPAGGKTRISLNEFIPNGSGTGSGTAAVSGEENYLFVIDFSGAPDFTQKNLCVSFGTTASASKPARIVFNIGSVPKVYTMVSNDATGETGQGNAYERESEMTVGITTTATSVSGVDTTGDEVQMGVRIRLKNRDAGAYVEIPSDWSLSSGGKESLPSGKNLNVFLGSNMQESSSSMKITMKNSDLPAGNYQWELNLVSASLSDFPGELTRTPIYVNFSLTDKRYSIAADFKNPDESRVYPVNAPESGRSPLTFHVTMEAANGAPTASVKQQISLWKKETATGQYTRVDLGTIFSAVSGMNLVSDWTPSGDYSLTLKDTIPAESAGTYRICFELSDQTGGGSQTLVYDTENIIIAEDSQ